jgi:Domain of unknown function (DUF4177)
MLKSCVSFSKLPKAPMKKFEYKVLITNWKNQESILEIENILNLEGKEGWELVSTNRDEYPQNPQNGEQILLIFKRNMKSSRKS